MNICVYGAASQQIHTDFLQGAHQLGHCLAKAGFGLVFGGGNTGVMGACARGAAQTGGQILGVAPSFFNQEGVLYPSCTTLHLTDTMRQRKEMMEHLSHGFVMAPGGIGTLEEFFEILTLKSLGRLDRPLVLYNINGYYDKMKELLEHTASENFMETSVLEICVFLDKPEEIIEYIEKYPKKY